MKTADLTGAALDWAVAKCEGRKPSAYGGAVRATAHPQFPDSPPMFGPELRYSTDWAQGGPIIEREKFDLSWQSAGREGWMAYADQGLTDAGVPLFDGNGPTPLIAAMRCYVASKLGDEIDVPKELL